MSGRQNVKKISSKDVAKLAGVAQSTVSRVFSDKSDLISIKTREKVKKAAQELGYRPSVIARSLSTRGTKIIGIEMNDYTNPYYMKALGLFSRAFQDEGYNLMVFDGSKVEDGLQRALEYEVAGLILTNAVLSDEYLSWCDKYQVPIFMFNRISGENHPFNNVIGDNYHGGHTIGSLLVDQGYKEIGYLAGDENAYTNVERERGFRESLEDAGKAYTKFQGSFNYESGYALAKEVMDHDLEFDVIFCASDSMALGFIDGAKHLYHQSIPKNIGVVGFDGIDQGSNINYGLTTYQQPLEGIVKTTVDSMISQIESGSKELVKVKLKGQMVMRSSLI